jgi:hypothetical protein
MAEPAGLTTPLLLSRRQIDPSRWNALVQQSPQQVLYGYSWYLDTVSPDWSALVWPSAEEYRVVLPLPTRTKAGLRVVQQPFFCQYMGFFATQEVPPELALLFLRALDRHFRYISTYSFHPLNTPLLRALWPAVPALLSSTLHTHWLPLHQSFTDLQRTYHPDRRLNLRRAEKAGWTVQTSDDPEPLIGLFRHHHAHRIGGGVSENAYQLLREVRQTLSTTGTLLLRYALLNGEIHAGVLLAEQGNRVLYLFNAADPIGRRLNARTYLLNQYFEEKAGTADLVFDFESPEVPSVASYYRSFGAQEKEFFQIRKNGLPFPLNRIQEWRRLRASS